MTSGPILCVDDEPVNLGVLRQALKNDFALCLPAAERKPWMR